MCRFLLMNLRTFPFHRNFLESDRRRERPNSMMFATWLWSERNSSQWKLANAPQSVNAYVTRKRGRPTHRTENCFNYIRGGWEELIPEMNGTSQPGNQQAQERHLSHDPLQSARHHGKWIFVTNRKWRNWIIPEILSHRDLCHLCLKSAMTNDLCYSQQTSRNFFFNSLFVAANSPAPIRKISAKHMDRCSITVLPVKVTGVYLRIEQVLIHVNWGWASFIQERNKWIRHAAHFPFIRQSAKQTVYLDGNQHGIDLRYQAAFLVRNSQPRNH